MGYRIEEAKDEIYFYVKDTGIGIPADKIDKSVLNASSN